MEIARLDDLQVVQRCKEGSEAAYAELVRRHRPRLYSLACRLTGDRDTAEDVVQETFVAAFRALDRFEPRPSLAAWLNTIAVRTAARAVGAGRANRRTSLDAMLDDDAERLVAATATDAGDPHLAAEAAELRREVARAIAKLPFHYRAAVVTRHVLGMDYAEAAAALETGLNTYKSHLLRGTRMLREILAPANRSKTPAGARTVRPSGASGVGAITPAWQVSAATTVGTPIPPAARSFADQHRARFEAVPKEKPVRG